MCGIIGSLPSSKINIRNIRHRGPDDFGMEELDDLSLGQVRLSILDLSQRGHQPMWDKEKKVLVAYNGEIYNYNKLGFGHESCDTIILVEKLAKEGAGIKTEDLDGMYAFAAYFVNEKKLVLCRDPVGIKPLYIAFSKDGQRLAFCSEIKGFFGIDWFNPLPNKDESIQRDFLQYGYTYPRSESITFSGIKSNIILTPTLIEGVYQICPGQKLIISLTEKPISSFSKLEETKGDPIEYLSRTVKEQVMSDVEVGVQLSGGVDSSLVAYECARRSKGKPLHGFYVSIDYGNLCEDKWANKSSEKLSELTDFSFHYIKLNQKEIKRILPKVTWYMDEPNIRHPNSLGVYLLCEYVKNKTDVKVLLTGEGADEVFGGYMWHDGKNIKNYDRSRRFFNLGGSVFVSQYLSQKNNLSILERQLAYDRKFYLPPILARQDRMSMAHSIESRVPFLANRFLGLASPRKQGKIVLKRYASKIFGEEFAYRRKCGFGIPWKWLLLEEFNPEFLDWMKKVPRTIPILTRDYQKWVLLSLSLWSKLYLYGGHKRI